MFAASSSAARRRKAISPKLQIEHPAQRKNRRWMIFPWGSGIETAWPRTVCSKIGLTNVSNDSGNWVALSDFD